MSSPESKRKSHNLANMKYAAKSYDTITFIDKKGKREEYKQAAKARGLGLMEMYRLAIAEYIQNHPVND